MKMAQQTKNDKKLERERQFLNKKVELSKNLYRLICNNKKYKASYLTKVLKAYGKELAKLELKQCGIHRPVVFLEVNNKKPLAPNGSARYKTKIPGISAISLNYDRAVQSIRDTSSPQEKAIILTNFAQTVLHESTHIEQHEVCEKSKKIKDFCSSDAYKYSQEFLAKDVLGNRYYKKGENYWKMLFERNAREEGFAKSIEILRKLSTPEEMNFFYTSEKMDDVFNDAYLEPESLSDVDGELIDRYTLNNRIAANAISKNPKLLKKYPILKKAFNKDGSRKHLYQTIKECARAEKMLRLNPFLSSDKRKEKIAESNALYSEIFVQSFDFVDKKEIDKTCKVAGKVAFNAMISKVEINEKNKLKDLVSNIHSEKMLREKFNVDTPNINNIYYQRMEYAKYVEQDVNESIDYFRKGIAANPHKKLSLLNAKKIVDKDKQLVKNNLKHKRFAPISNKRTVYHSYDEKKTYSDYEFNGDLEEMRDLSQQYKQLEESKVQKRDRIRDEYNELSMSINEKEKNNGIKY